MKPKLHFLVHYPRILLLLGPVVKFWCMRFESFHQLIKRNANSSNNAKNLLKTVAKKQALKMCETVHNFTYQDNVTFGDILNCKTKNYFPDKRLNEQCIYYDHVNFHDVIYKLNTFIVINTDELDVEFGKIINIVCLNSEVYFEIEVFEETCFDEHFYAFIVKSCNTNRFIKFSELPDINPLHAVVQKNDIYLVAKYGL